MKGEKKSKKENLIMKECLLDYFYSFEKKIEALLPLNKKTLWTFNISLVANMVGQEVAPLHSYLCSSRDWDPWGHTIACSSVWPKLGLSPCACTASLHSHLCQGPCMKLAGLPTFFILQKDIRNNYSKANIITTTTDPNDNNEKWSFT